MSASAEAKVASLRRRTKTQLIALDRALSEHQWTLWLEDASEREDYDQARCNQCAKPTLNAPLMLLLLAQESMLGFFERSISDNPASVLLWKSYAQYLNDCGKPAEHIRNVYERALDSCGLHPRLGGVLFSGLREAEQSLLDDAEDEGSDEDVQTAIKRLDKLYIRQLSVPLYGNDDTLQEYKEWRQEQNLDEISESVSKSHEKCKTMLDARDRYERSLDLEPSKEQENLRANYMSYVQFETAHGDPARVRLVYERALLQLPAEASLWNEYLAYMERELRIRQQIDEVSERAARFCQDVGSLWCATIRSAELAAQQDKVYNRFNAALQVGFSTADKYLDVFLAFLDFARRQVASDTDIANREDGRSFLEDFRDAARQCVDYLDQTFPTFRDTHLKLPAYWARTEAKVFKDIAVARQIFEEFCTKKGYASMANVWECYVDLERELGNVNAARALFKRCFSRRLTLANGQEAGEHMCERWLRFEREEGSALDYKNAADKIAPKIGDLKRRREQAATTKTSGSNKRARNAGNKYKVEAADSRKVEGDKKKRNASKRDAELDVEEEPGSKRTKDEASTDNDAAMEVDVSNAPNASESPEEPSVRTIFVYSLNQSTTRSELYQLFSRYGKLVSFRVPPHQHDEQRIRGFAYIEFSCRAEADAAIELDGEEVRGRKIVVEKSKKTVRPTELQGQSSTRQQEGASEPTIFVKHIHWRCTEKEVMKLFSTCGHVVSLRMPKKADDSKNHRGFAYVQLNSEEEVQRAVEALNGTKLKGKEIFAAPSNASISSAQQPQVQSQEHTPAPGSNKRDQQVQQSGSKRQNRPEEDTSRRRHKLGEDGQATEGKNDAQQQRLEDAGERKPRSNEDFRKELGLGA